MNKLVVIALITLSLIGCSSSQIIETEKSKQIVNTQNIDNVSNLPFLEIYKNEFPKNIGVEEKYQGGHPEILNYVFVITIDAKVRELPGGNTAIKETLNFNERLKALGKVDLYGTKWYKVETTKGEIGYISDALVTFRTFRFNEILNEINKAETFVNKGKENGDELAIMNSYIPNPNNKNLKFTRDKYGMTADQNVVAKSNGETIFIPDRSIIKVLENDGKKAKVKVSSIKEEFLEIDSKYISKQPKLVEKPINKAVAIDTKNQNMVMFEKINGNWTIISYVYSKTGIESELGFETPKGHMLAATAKFEMLYNNEIGLGQGYAKYATRFSGGGYVHGTPLNYDETINTEYFMSQKELFLGTFTGTRKCVRTTEDHAKFIFDWILDG
ncbi:MAG: SH3 domain-containing protein, partial [Fusobacteriaceae bacterium]